MEYSPVKSMFPPAPALEFAAGALAGAAEAAAAAVGELTAALASAATLESPPASAVAAGAVPPLVTWADGADAVAKAGAAETVMSATAKVPVETRDTPSCRRWCQLYIQWMVTAGGKSLPGV